VGVAKADTITIKSDGRVILTKTNQETLGDSTNSQSPRQQNSIPFGPPINTLLLASSGVINMTVTVSPPSNNGEGLNVSILDATSPQNSITKNVNQVVQENVNGEQVLSIASVGENQMVIKQGEIQALTSLPIQIDPTTHSVSVITNNGPVEISILPLDAVRIAGQQRLISNPAVAKITLDKDQGQLVYVIEAEKRAKLFNFFEITTPVKINIHVQTGKVVKVSQSLAFSAIESINKALKAVSGLSFLEIIINY
jgi:hypothetical protein